MASRRTQPYRRRSGRHPGAALDAMKRGTDGYGRNRLNSTRALAAKRKKRGRVRRKT